MEEAPTKENEQQAEQQAEHQPKEEISAGPDEFEGKAEDSAKPFKAPEATPSDGNGDTKRGPPADDDEPEGKPIKIKRRKKKDPSAPKRPLSAYNLYFRDTRLALKKANDSRLSFESLVKTVSSQWKAVDADTREKYDAAAKVDYNRYNEEMSAYRGRPEIQNSLVDPTAKGRRKFLGVPKRPLSGYNIFFREEHARIKSLRSGGTEGGEGSNMTVEIAKRWSQLDVKEKSELNQRAAATQKAIETAELQREANLRECKAPKLGLGVLGRGPAGYMPAGHPLMAAHLGGEDAMRHGHLAAYGAPGFMGHQVGLEGGGDQAALAQQQAQWQHEQHMRLLMQYQHQQHQAQLMGAGHPVGGAGHQQAPGGGQPGASPAPSDQQAMMAQHQAMMQWQQQEWARQQWQQQQWQQHQQQQQQGQAPPHQQMLMQQQQQQQQQPQPYTSGEENNGAEEQPQQGTAFMPVQA